jgi:hypothetical protein
MARKTKEDRGAGGKIILNCILQKQYFGVWNAFLSFTKDFSGGYCAYGNELSG